MTDRELLKMAAKALGWVDYPDDPIEMGQYWHAEKNKAPFGKRIRKEHFNPLEDDGDTLRLAITLPTINISAIIMAAWQAHNDDISRRAYVRREVTKAAAEIGRVMK